MYKVQREGRLLKREEGQGTLFINRIGGEKGSVSQLWLKMHCYEGGDGRAKGLFTSFFHLLDLEGERKGMEQACTRGRAASPCALCVSITLTWRGLRPPSLLTCVCQTPARPQPPPPQQQRQPAQRSAAQQTGRPGCSLTAASAHRKGMALLWKRAAATAAVAPGRAASASDRRGARGLVGERQGTAAGARCVGKYL